MAGIQDTLDRMTPEEAVAEIAGALKKLLPLVTDEARIDFVVKVIGGPGDDKVTSMVHL